MATEAFIWLFLNQIPSLGPLRFQRLLQVARSAQGILAMNASDLMAAEVDTGVAQGWFSAFRDPALWRAAESDWSRAEKGEFRIITELDPHYPGGLRELPGRPPVLYVQGRWPLPDGLVLGLVGTRRCSPYGETVAKEVTA